MFMRLVPAPRTPRSPAVPNFRETAKRSLISSSFPSILDNSGFRSASSRSAAVQRLYSSLYILTTPAIVILLILSIITTDINNIPRQEFKSNEKFRISLPISELSDGGGIKLKALANVETKPIFIGKAANSNNQDYAITGISYENGTGEKEIYYSKNETKLKIIKKDENGEKNLANAVFQLLDKDKNVIISELITDKNGEVVLEYILPGTYYIKEIQAPVGYILYDNYIQIRPEFNEELTVTIKNSKEEKPEIQISENVLKIKNEVKRLPKTGM